MGKHVLLATILVFLVVADVANASFFRNARRLSAPSPNNNPNVTVSPIPSPKDNIEKQSSPVGSEEKTKEKQKQLSPVGGGGDKKVKEKQDQQSSPGSTSGQEKTKAEEIHDTGLPPPTESKGQEKTPKEEVKEKDEGNESKGQEKTPKEEVKQKDEGKSELPVGAYESCDGVVRRCQDTKSMIACVKSFDDVSKALVLFIQNEGDSSLKVDLTIPPRNKQNSINIAKHQSKKVNLPLASVNTNEITLNAGYGDCVLHLGAPVSQGNYFQWLPSYSKFMTPVYGAYFLVLTTLIAGGVWACCWFGKRKKQTDIPYQELEMSMPESAVAAESAEGWDQGWDDDWDEEKAVKSPGGRNISANGLTSRTPNKDGWEDWDD